MAYTPVGPYGGNGGAEFSNDLTVTTGVAEIQAWVNPGHGTNGIIRGLKITWNTTASEQQEVMLGQANGAPAGTLTLGADEALAVAEGRAGKYLDHLTLLTDQNNKLDVGGTGGDAFPVFTGGIGGFFGRDGSDIDQIGFYVQQT